MNTSTKDHFKAFAFWLCFVLIIFTAIMFCALRADGQTVANVGQTIITTTALTPPAPGTQQKVIVTSVVVKPPPPMPAVSLSWTGDPRATNYVLFMGHASGVFFTNFSFTGTNVTVTNLNPRLPYVFSICADGSNGLVTPPCPETRWNVSNAPMLWQDAKGMNMAFVVPPGHAAMVTAAASPSLLDTAAATVWSSLATASNALRLVSLPVQGQQYFKVVEK